jgi:dimethylaniline monooxygenase (N-oxide forming)
MIPALRALARTKGATDGGDLLAAAALGRIRIKPALASVRYDQVTFEDGSSDRFDAVIFDTGFTRDLPFSFSLAKRKDETRDELLRSSSKRAEKEKIPSEKNASPLPRLYRGVLCADAPRVAFVLYVLPFGSHFQVAELQAAWAARVWRGELGTPSAEDMRRHGEPLARLAAHDATGEFYRAAYARLLAPSVFRTEGFFSLFAKLVRGSRNDSGTRVGPKYVEPVLEWLPDPDARDFCTNEGPWVPSDAVFRDAGAADAFARDGWSGWSVS